MVEIEKRENEYGEERENRKIKYAVVEWRMMLAM